MSDTTTEPASTPTPLEGRATPANTPGPPTTRARTEALLQAFLAGRSPDTLRTYASCLRGFQAWLGAPSLPAAAETLLTRPAGDANAIVLNYRNHLHAAGKASATI